MPVVFRYKGYRFLFYSNEGDPREPLHIHIQKGSAVAKVWLIPIPCVAESYGLTAHELNELLTIAVENREKIERCWHEYFDDQSHGKKPAV
ncbi:MAG: hypothetical protein A3G34_13200 [Candidatus Lindowbacteria bacterium RIFCSPLOWO2_12_FULL_62_27]|nr:MAG: hypothetical protein A3G34_13200 [Candidatus Lindowbacteria bacterium RIFCSPLOWO2_12_FULL_62_27]